MTKLAAKLTSQFVMLLLIAAAALLLVAGTGVWGLSQTHGAADKLYNDQLRTVDETTHVGQELDDSYETAQGILLATTPQQRQQLTTDLFQNLVPSVEEALTDLRLIHAGDPHSQVALVQQLENGWSRFRTMWNAQSLLAASPDTSVVLAQLNAAFGPLEGVTDRLLVIEQHDANIDHQHGDNAFNTSLLVIGLAVGIELLLGVVLAWYLSRRMLPRALAPEEAQAKFAEAMQLTASQDAGRRMLQRYLTQSIKASRVAIIAIDNNTNELEGISTSDGLPEMVEALRAEGTSCLAMSTARSHGESGDPDQLMRCDLCGARAGFSVCTPLVIGGEVVGSVLVNRDHPLDLDDERRIRDSILQAGPVLANLRNLTVAETQAATDSLTGLPNKGSIDATLRRMVAQAQRSTTTLALLSVDLDHFKSVNDTYGHPRGDDVLVAVGRVLRSTLRSSDVAGRNGGEEFLVILSATDIDGACKVAENVRAAIAEIRVPGVDQLITMSIGVAVLPVHALDADGLLRSADRALYRAKAEGRNRVETANPPDSLSPLTATQEDLPADFLTVAARSPRS